MTIMVIVSIVKKGECFYIYLHLDCKKGTEKIYLQWSPCLRGKPRGATQSTLQSKVASRYHSVFPLSPIVAK